MAAEFSGVPAAVYPYTGERPIDEQPAREGGYNRVLGQYIVGYYPERFTNGSIPLQRIELFLARVIKRRLANPPANRPVRALDIGGGIGVTWLKLGYHFRKRVDAGELMLGVTNVARTPEDYLNGDPDEDMMARPSPSLRRFYDLNRHRVEYADADFTAEGLPSFKGSDGQEVPLEGQWDVVHELSSLSTWCRYPQPAILRAGRLVSPEGIYLVDRASTQQLITPFGARYEARDRKREIAAAHEQLVDEVGLQRLDLPGHPVLQWYVGFHGPEFEPAEFGLAPR